MLEYYAIVGPEDHNTLPSFWNSEVWAWVEFHRATLFDARILCGPLPMGARCLLDVRTIDTTWKTYPGGRPVDTLIQAYRDRQEMLNKSLDNWMNGDSL